MSHNCILSALRHVDKLLFAKPFPFLFQAFLRLCNILFLLSPYFLFVSRHVQRHSSQVTKSCLSKAYFFKTIDRHRLHHRRRRRRRRPPPRPAPVGSQPLQSGPGNSCLVRHLSSLGSFHAPCQMPISPYLSPGPAHTHKKRKKKRRGRVGAEGL